MSNNNQPQIIQATALPVNQSPTVTVINPNFNNTSPPVKFQLAFSYSKTHIAGTKDTVDSAACRR